MESQNTTKRRRLNVIVFTVLALGFVMRADILMSPVSLSGDAAGRYYPLARNVLDGHGFSRHLSPPHTPDNFDQPGYPLFLAAILWLSKHNFQAVVLAQLGLEAGTLLLTAWLGRLLKLRSSVRLNAVLLGLACPFLPLWSARFMTEVLTTFMAILACCVFVRAARAHSGHVARWWALAGLCGGLCLAVRADMAPAVALMMLAALLASRQRRRRGARRTTFRLSLCLGVMLCVLAPWTLRNYLIFKTFLPLGKVAAQQSNGYVVWLGTWVDDTRFHKPFWWDILKDSGAQEFPASRIPDPLERQRAWEALSLARRNKMFPGGPSGTFLALAARAKQRRPLETRVLTPLRRVASTWLHMPDYTPLFAIKGFERHGEEHVPGMAEEIGIEVNRLFWHGLLLLAIIGFFYGLWLRPSSMAPVFALILGRSLLAFISGIGTEPRYMVETLPACFLLGALGIEAARPGIEAMRRHLPRAARFHARPASSFEPFVPPVPEIGPEISPDLEEEPRARSRTRKRRRRGPDAKRPTP